MQRRDHRLVISSGLGVADVILIAIAAIDVVERPYRGIC